jgi:hypothetical protein
MEYKLKSFDTNLIIKPYLAYVRYSRKFYAKANKPGRLHLAMTYCITEQ